MQRALIVGGIIVGIIAVAALVWFLFFTPKNGGVTATPGSEFPDGGAFEGGAEAPGVGDAQKAGEEVAPHFIRITEGPVALGVAAVASTRTKEVTPGTSTPISVLVPDTEVRYVERASGNIYAYKVSERTLTRLTNRTIPGIQDATWLADGSAALVRYLGEEDDVETYVLPVEGDDGYPLERGLSQVLATSTSIITVLSSTNGSVATIANADGTNARTLFSSLLSSLRLSSAGASYLATTKASAQADGYAFTVSGGSFERILGPLKGLTALSSPSGAYVLYAYVSGSSVKAAVYNRSTHTATALPIAALPDKCVFAPHEKSIYCGVPRATPFGWPDAWYQGVEHTTDRIWRIDLESRLASLVVDPKVAGDAEIDAVALTLDENADALVFTNRNDGSLWLYDL